MDIEKYISSGILEAYVLDTLSAEERKGVEDMVNQYPELQAELEAIELSLEAVAMRTAVTPPAGLKDSILSAVEESTPTEAPVQETKVVTMEQPSTTWKYLVAASIALALISGYMAFDYRAKWKSTNEAYAELVGNNTLMADQYNKVNQRLEGIERDFEVVSNTEFLRVPMAGTENALEASASVFWNKRTEELFLNIQNLKDLSEDQQYQLWAIIDGKPVDAGVFDLGAEGLIKMKNTASQAVAFAVTIEPKGGSEAPHLETMQVIGNVG
ncbi:anti-sigma factor domain-containing protein [Roseivirga sp. E12]|uniref:anti-sigma factor n=1 Tax=Roseivirga sp. E12 TaxID=2819237 RepID=UPI001ABC87BB|nr:anti-sigma factor [Roseivirga sp. E12]MBO3699167.1 anti-sigma factor [Roseivirga sp. E12]